MSAPSKPAAGLDGPAVPERRTLAFPLDGVTLRESGSGDGTIHLAGHAAVFDKLSHDLGGFRERIDRGAFTNVLDGDPDVHLVVGHDMTRVLARTRSKTLELREDPAGLRVWARLDPDDPDVQALVPKMRRGDVDQMSFAFTVKRDTWMVEGDGDDEAVTRTVHEVAALFDVSVVAQGAYPQTDANLRGLLEAARSEGRLVRQDTEDHHTDAPEPPAVESPSPTVDGEGGDEQRTTAPDGPADGDSPPTSGDEAERDLTGELHVAKSEARMATQLAKRRLLAAQRKETP